MNNERNNGSFAADQQYRQLFAQAPAPIAIYEGRELRYVFVNEAYSRIFNGRDILGKTVREAFPELSGQGFYEILENVFDSGHAFHADEIPAAIDLQQTGRPETRYYNLVYTPFRNEAGVIEGVMAFGHDVTAQVLARQQSEETDQRFRNVVEQAPDPILILKGEDLVLEVANEPLFRLWQAGPDAIGKTFLELLPEMKDQPFISLLRDVYRTGTTHYGYESPAVFQRADGTEETLYFNFVYQPYREIDGRITGVIIIASDVTGQVQVRRQLVESEQNFRNLIMQAPLGIAILKGPALVLELANDVYFAQAGKSREELIGRSVWEVMPEIRAGFEPLLQEVMRTGVPYHGKEAEVRMVRHGKEEVFYVDFVYQPLRDIDGSVSGIMSIGTDVTDKVLARKKVEDSGRELQWRVKQRTAELEKKNSELEQFAYVASHDLQEPLRKIKAFGELLKGRYAGQLEESGADMITRMQDAAERMRMLIDALLSYSQLSVQTETMQPVDLNEVVQEVRIDLETAIGEKAAQLLIGPLPVVNGAALQLRQLFQNLLSNALKFSRQGETPVVRVRSEAVSGQEAPIRRGSPEPGRMYHLIEVADNGIGFEPEYADKIFQIFQRLHGRTVYPGSGVGLSIVQRVVANHHGFIDVASEPGKGTTFRILLPAEMH